MTKGRRRISRRMDYQETTLARRPCSRQGELAVRAGKTRERGADDYDIVLRRRTREDNKTPASSDEPAGVLTGSYGWASDSLETHPKPNVQRVDV